MFGIFTYIPLSCVCAHACAHVWGHSVPHYPVIPCDVESEETDQPGAQCKGARHTSVRGPVLSSSWSTLECLRRETQVSVPPA